MIKMLFKLVLAVAIATPFGFLISKKVTAAFDPQELVAHVEIEGVAFGTFSHFSLKDLTNSPQNDEKFTRITLKRDFVTEPSLYLWARDTIHNRSGLNDIHLVMRNDDDQEVSRYVLKYCQPLSWAVEASDPAFGGFYEKIELAVQEIAIF